MHTAPSQVTSAHVTNAVPGSKKDKVVLAVAGSVMSLAAVIAAFWFYSSDHPSADTSLTPSQVGEALKTNSPPPVTTVSFNENQKIPMAAASPGSIHTDIYFEIGRRGLTDEAKTLLQKQAVLLMNDANLGVLVQGYTDQQGSTGYNMRLGLGRAESVKTELMNAGVQHHQIKVVSLGKDGALCADNSDVCRQMNRRVHLEIRAIGHEHMIAPAVATTPSSEAAVPFIDASQKAEDSNSVIDSLVPSADASQLEIPWALPPAPPSGN